MKPDMKLAIETAKKLVEAANDDNPIGSLVFGLVNDLRLYTGDHEIHAVTFAMVDLTDDLIAEEDFVAIRILAQAVIDVLTIR